MAIFLQGTLTLNERKSKVLVHFFFENNKR